MPTNELGAFLEAHHARVDPREVGLPTQSISQAGTTTAHQTRFWSSSSSGRFVRPVLTRLIRRTAMKAPS